ncbi:MAG: 50S ribosomal protein L17 [Candidatus Sumerlaeota bacterium]|jgi:large subunit ribosomal protein L17|nr:50S ribosomal protein L17 [Candidatus Sumerlaeota bacterium]
MRHRKVKSKLNRTTEHRLALMRNLAAALIRNERILTTEAKAKNLRPFVERLITLGKRGDLAARRLVFSRLGKKEAVHKLFTEIAPRFTNRPGGYTRIVKGHFRAGDSAPMAFIEFVEMPEKEMVKKKKPKRLHIHA